MGLCKICAKLDLEDLLDEDGLCEDISHHKSFEDLEQSATKCELCNLIHSQFAQEIALDKIEKTVWADSPVVIRGRRYTVRSGDEYGLFAIKIRCDRAGAVARVFLAPYVDDRTLSANSALGEFILGREIKPADARFDFLRRLIADCDAGHSLCAGAPGPLPTRVIDIGQSSADDPYLKITPGNEVGHYAALSHCWGANPLVRTTSSNINDHRRLLPINALPKTFRDAIQICQELRLRYLWIDSLCIIQDDMLDWERESVKMGEVYSSAFITIAASASTDSTGGCFLPRTCEEKIQVKCGSSRVYIRRRPLDFNTLRTRHLHTRGWVTQERALSRRMIHFDADQLLWECREARIAEDGVPFDAYAQISSAVWDERLHMAYPYIRRGYLDGQFIWDWYGLVEAYSGKSLTKADDKLPAISGLARVMEQRTGEKYIAGLWINHLSIGLLWRRADDRWLVRPSGGYRAPSWSWAALDGEIDMPSEGTYNDDANKRDHLCVVEVINAHTTPLGLDSKGKLAGGEIQLRGRFKKADPRLDPKMDGYKAEFEPTKQIQVDYLFSGGQWLGKAFYDEEYQPNSPHVALPVYCLEMTRNEREFPKWVGNWTGLLLQETEKLGGFKRVGFANAAVYSWEYTIIGRPGEDVKSWFDDAETVTVTIV
jgi:hypothetical protein